MRAFRIPRERALKHSRSGYAQGCRCEICTVAQRDYQREYAARKRSEGTILGASPRDCVQCGTRFLSKKPASRFCSKACYGASMDCGVGPHKRRISKSKRLAIYERDDWTCHICGDPVNRAAKVPELDAPTLDHVIALAAGGAHDEANLKTAHFYCNSVKRELPLASVA